MANNIKFVLNGCDISFFAEAPEDITLKQLLEQTDKIFPDWCACGICSLERYNHGYGENGWQETELLIDYDSIRKVGKYGVSCEIKEHWRDEK